MPFALNLTLDAEAFLGIERVYAGLGAWGINEQDLVTHYGPCVTILVVDDGVHPDDILENVRRHVPTTQALAIRFTEPCVIHGSPPTLGLRVSPTDGLLALHNALFRALPEQVVHLHYRPAYWQPHLKLANVSADMAVTRKLVAAMAATWRSMAATLTALEVIRYSPIEVIWKAQLLSSSEITGRSP